MDFKFPGVIDVDPDEWPKDQKRFIKTHLPYDMLPQDFKDKKCKIIYVMRNPKDVSVSYYYFLRMLNYNPFRDYTLHNIIQKFLFGLIPYGPYWEHNLGYWNEAKENPEHIMVVKFEDMIKVDYVHNGITTWPLEFLLTTREV
ncbi:PREDICTED: flavonol 4'-sulfotransferase-like [Priapulus caudatus]|uniref:Flavonol 4'-sulfotransferase-like n=1 Tax=Priapulus caudatus TaxID=37621 RepID=A0ABM1DXF3_PRICU|nr:PREDICTED: flavonol 4'-sulfotransferase-like [Priapulus caudatus]